MTEPFVGEIRPIAFTFTPEGWAECNGQLLPLQQNTALFVLLGTTFGGNGTTNFGLPNLQGMMPMGQGAGPGLTPRSLGETGGAESVALRAAELPAHTHTLQALKGLGTTNNPSGALWAQPRYGRAAEKSFAPAGTGAAEKVPMNSGMVSNTGSGSPHNNMPPFLPIRFVIALQGVFPPRW